MSHFLGREHRAYGFKGDGGSAIGAQFSIPYDLKLTPNGDLLVADTANLRVRKITSGTVNTIAGVNVGDSGPALSAYLNTPAGIAVAPNGDVYFSDSDNNRIRRVTTTGNISTAAGTGLGGSTQGRIYQPLGMTFDAQGMLYFADSGNNRIQRITPAGNMSTYMGGTPGFAGDGGPGQTAQFSFPFDVAADAAGNFYISDMGNLRVREVDATTSNIKTIAGTGKPGSSGLNGPATSAQMGPMGIALDMSGNLYIADGPNNRVLKVAAASGTVSMVAGTGAPGFSGDGGPATQAKLNRPTDVVIDSNGVLYVADYNNQVVRKVSAAGMITTIAGSGKLAFDRDNAPALSAGLDPFALALGSNGSLYIADFTNDRIRKLTPVNPQAMTAAVGNNQSGDPGSKTVISVKVMDTSGNPLPGILVNFVVTSGSATLSASTAITGMDGTASVTATYGSTAGPVVITASSTGVPSATFRLTVNQVITTPLPQISSGGIVGAGLSLPAQHTLAVGGIATIFGLNFAPDGTGRKVGPADLINGKVPVNFAGVCVQVGTVRAPVFAVYPGQINFQLPSVASGSVAVRVLTGCDTSSQLQSGPENVTISDTAPEFFYFVQNTSGKNPVVAVDAINGALLGTSTLLGGGFTPAQPGEIVSVYGTSFGATTPPVAPGDFPIGIGPVNGQYRVTLGGKDLDASDVFYAGVSGSPGLYQLNFRVPANAPNGDLSLVLTIGSASSPAGAYLTVQSPAQ